MTEYAYRPTADPTEVERMTEDGWELVMGEERVAYGMRVSWLLRRPRKKPDWMVVKEQLREALGRLEDAEGRDGRDEERTRTDILYWTETLKKVVKIMGADRPGLEELDRAVSRVQLVIESLEKRLPKEDGKRDDRD